MKSERHQSFVENFTSYLTDITHPSPWINVVREIIANSFKDRTKHVTLYSKIQSLLMYIQHLVHRVNSGL
jgi:hypothetical protein